MNIEHKLEPIEHWIVDGEAYRLAKAEDIGRLCYRSDTCIGEAIKYGQYELTGIEPGEEYPYTFGIDWRFAYIQDDSLLQPNRVDLVEFEVKRTPVPALGEGWYLLTAEDGECNESDQFSYIKGVWGACKEAIGHQAKHWINGGWAIARYFGPIEDTETKPGPTEEPSPKPIDWTKPVRTKDGRAVRVLCTDGPGDYPVAGYIAGETNPRSWTLDGYLHINERHSTLDLENAPQRIQRELWVNVYSDGAVGSLHQTKGLADSATTTSRLACVKITIDCEEGEGL